MSGRYRVLLLDPVKSRREQAARLLGMRFDVAEASTPKEALDAIKSQRPNAIVATLRQVEENGLIIAKGLRAAVGRDAFILVHGPTTSCTTAAERRTVLEKHGVDQWAPSVLTPEDLDAVIGSRASMAMLKRPPRVPLWQRMRAISRKDVWIFLTKPRHLIPTPPRGPDGKPTWIELLNRPPTIENVRELMTKTIF